MFCLRQLGTLLIAILLNAVTISAAAAGSAPVSGAATPVLVAFATPITVHVKSEVSSSHSQTGDSMALLVADDVVVNGYVVIAKGADGLAIVDNVTPSRTNSPGQVHLTFKWVRAVDGSKIGVSGQHTGIGRSGSGNADAASTLSDTSNAALSAGANQAANFLGRANNVLRNLTAHAKQSEASVVPDQTISLEVRNPNGVTILSSRKSALNDDSDVK